MKDCSKYNRILDVLQELLENKDIKSISVSENPPGSFNFLTMF